MRVGPSTAEFGRTEALARLRLAVVVATTGRPATVFRMIERLSRQTRPPDRLLVVAVVEDDVVGLEDAGVKVQTTFAPRGLCSQRNHGVAVLDGDADVLIFFDDDFLPADDYLAAAERLFIDNDDIVGATGRMIADGAQGPGIGYREAVAILADDSPPADANSTRPLRALYGCNMAYRATAMAGMRFDENLPLYGWQEDIDFSYRMAERGRLVKSAALAGVHLGEKAGRISGKRFGYSQIANPLYLLEKDTIPRDLALRLMRKNIASNLVRSLYPEPHIDRRGRLAGNLLGLWDLARRRLHPGRILDFA